MHNNFFLIHESTSLALTGGTYPWAQSSCSIMILMPAALTVLCPEINLAKVSLSFKQRKATVLESHWDMEVHLLLQLKTTALQQWRKQSLQHTAETSVEM